MLLELSLGTCEIGRKLIEPQALPFPTKEICCKTVAVLRVRKLQFSKSGLIESPKHLIRHADWPNIVRLMRVAVGNCEIGRKLKELQSLAAVPTTVSCKHPMRSTRLQQTRMGTSFTVALSICDRFHFFQVPPPPQSPCFASCNVQFEIHFSQPRTDGP